MAKYYHITTEENAEKILKEGLKPDIGERERTVFAYDIAPAIYLCTKYNIVYWEIILDLHTVLEVECNIDYSNEYGDYQECIVHEEILPDKITKYVPNISQGDYRNAMRNLCIDNIWSLSKFCNVCVQYYGYNKSYHDSIMHDEIIRSSDALSYYKDKLDYSYISKEDIRNEIKRQGEDYAFTVCDMYYNTGKRLYEMLIKYPEDDLSECRRKVYDYICENLEGCLDIDTGGLLMEVI